MAALIGDRLVAGSGGLLPSVQDWRFAFDFTWIPVDGSVNWGSARRWLGGLLSFVQNWGFALDFRWIPEDGRIDWGLVR